MKVACTVISYYPDDVPSMNWLLIPFPNNFPISPISDWCSHSFPIAVIVSSLGHLSRCFTMGNKTRIRKPIFWISVVAQNIFPNVIPILCSLTQLDTVFFKPRSPTPNDLCPTLGPTPGPRCSADCKIACGGSFSGTCYFKKDCAFFWVPISGV